LKLDLSDNKLGDFLTDRDRIGIVCEKHRAALANGWSFPPLAECRAAWEAIYGAVEWHAAEVEEWQASAPAS
jgi:hypothetical protein